MAHKIAAKLFKIKKGIKGSKKVQSLFKIKKSAKKRLSGILKKGKTKGRIAQLKAKRFARKNPASVRRAALGAAGVGVGGSLAAAGGLQLRQLRKKRKKSSHRR